VHEALYGASSPRPNRLAWPRRDGALGGLTKPALGDDDDLGGTQYCSVEYKAELKKRGKH
jgi:hypothetical protein